MNDIRYLRRQQINISKWDQCISDAPNGLVYAYAWYLDHMSDNWDALVLGDYEAVMPLPWKKKWGIYYIYQPICTAQLGLFSKKSISAGLVDIFTAHIPAKFLFYDIAVNSSTELPKSVKTIHVNQRINFILSIDKSYDVLRSRYSSQIQRNIKKALALKVAINRDHCLDEIISTESSQLRQKLNLRKKDFLKIELLSKYAYSNNRAKIYCAYDASHQFLAGAIYFFSHKRYYYLVVGNTPASRKCGASALIIDTFIRDHANSDLLLDFEGSDIPSIARFYRGFGAEKKTYYHWYYNNLPPLIRLLK